ncbi:MAG TPA: hopanoid biosynthesis-associated protein HpnK [Caulobacteraceae bacterium]|nr:hopanoid biosynthesis-associated protein HpnK [Caulobacteraceae bacterium]
MNNPAKGLIVTADDFGLAEPVNEAVEMAHARGVLTCASLMVAGRAVADAVKRARKSPDLKIGLHVVLVEGRPVLPPGVVPDLVTADGRFRADMASAGVDMFFKAHVRRQLMAEVSAQFEAYAATGLPLDHATAHKHFHLHPTIAGAIITAGRRFGLKAVRVPVEPRATLRAAEPGYRPGPAMITGPWSHFVRRRFKKAGLYMPDWVFGLRWSGAMTEARLEGVLNNLPGGVSEIYLHPATRDDFEDAAPGYRYAEELAGLCASGVALAAGSVRRGGFSDFAAATR